MPKFIVYVAKGYDKYYIEADNKESVTIDMCNEDNYIDSSEDVSNIDIVELLGED